MYEINENISSKTMTLSVGNGNNNNKSYNKHWGIIEFLLSSQMNDPSIPTMIDDEAKKGEK